MREGHFPPWLMSIDERPSDSWTSSTLRPFSESAMNVGDRTILSSLGQSVVAGHVNPPLVPLGPTS